MKKRKIVASLTAVTIIGASAGTLTPSTSAHMLHGNDKPLSYELTDEEKSELKAKFRERHGGEYKGNHRGQHRKGRVLAEFLEMAPEELHERLQSGETMQDVTQAQGKSREEFEEFMSQKREQKLQGLIDQGKISQSEAESLQQKFSNLWNKTFSVWFGK